MKLRGGLDLEGNCKLDRPSMLRQGLSNRKLGAAKTNGR